MHTCRQNRRNHYRILQVQPDAPVEVIKANYRTLLQKLRLHPDLGGDHWNASLINQAWNTLRNPAKRAAYDQQLLQDHDIRTLSRGRLAGACAAPCRDRATPGAASGNRRNYYRILNIQTDAPAAIITASYRIQMRNPRAPISALQEAFAVLNDPRQRRAYDRALSGTGHPGTEIPDQDTAATPRDARAPAAPKPRPEPGAVPYQPLITQYCHFCKTPHAHSPMSDQSELCSDCASPLFAAAVESGYNSRRTLARISRHGELRFYRDWPGRAYAATLMDLSPEGLRFTTRESLHPDQVIKIDGDNFNCVSRVMHCRPGVDGESVGSRFITILFTRRQGNFVSARA